MDTPRNDVAGRGEPLQFKAWLVQQISSGKYKDLEWIDADKKRIFKIPWTKKNYPNWEEHHEIFKAWANYRGKIKSEPIHNDQHISLLKSNFRTILRKCSELEELKNFHQLGLQTGNYKVYKVLTGDEVQMKRAKPKLKQEAHSTDDTQSDIVEISSEGGVQNIPWLPQCNIPQEWISATSSLGMVVLESEQSQTLMKRSPSPGGISPKLKIRKTQATQTLRKDPHFTPKEVIFLSEPNVSESVTIPDSVAAYDVTQDIPYSIVEVQADNGGEEVSDEVFNTLLATVGAISDPSNQTVDENGIKILQGPGIVNVMNKLNLPREQLFTYDVEMKYKSQVIWRDEHCQLNNGVRFHNEIKKPSSQKTWPYLTIRFPSPSLDMGKHFDAVLQNMGSGFVLQVDEYFNLVIKRLCQCRIFTNTSYGDYDASEMHQIKRDDETILFNYSLFLQDWYLRLSNNETISEVEIHLSMGKRLQREDSKNFIVLRLVPKAAASILAFVSSLPTSQEVLPYIIKDS